uniref:Uncharacterized protein n=1 Tax=Oryza punctata TaxID=4537 RepID=A0A0E0JWB4_ORYPU
MSPMLDDMIVNPPLMMSNISLDVSAAAADATGDGGNGGVDDRISLLPDDLLRDIVSGLPAKDGARTAVLSSRWRHLWRSTPLVLVDTHLLPEEEGRRPPRAVADTVSRVLDAHPGPFLSVSLTTTRFVDSAQAARWLELLATKGVEHLIFVNRHSPLPCLRLPTEIFKCSSPRSLYIGAWALPAAAAAAAFPNLQELYLACVAMDDRDLNLLLQLYPPQLEQLSFNENITPIVRIGHAPQLRVLGYLLPGIDVLEIGNTIIKDGTTVSQIEQRCPERRFFGLENVFRNS